jgi:UbiD family decarboxylase
MKKNITSLRSTLEFLDATGELVTTDVEVDPHLEVAAIQKLFDGGAALLFNRVKGSFLWMFIRVSSSRGLVAWQPQIPS